ncbi:MAG: hypothetical protein U0359_06480 [Byssovorax sp.]
MTQTPDDKNQGDRAEDERVESGAAARKERVLHTRVPAVLERELKRFADNLRIPVSNLVRAILEDAISAADAAGESVEGRLRSAAQQLEKEREKLKKRVMPEALAEAYAFQPVTLAKDASCARCGKDLRRGERAHLGLVEPSAAPGERLFLCDACLPSAGGA